MSLEPILITGAAGQLGRAVAEVFADREIAACSRRELDITDRAAVDQLVDRLRPRVIVNCAANNHVDTAEDDPAAALEVNAFGVLTLATAASRIDAVLVHYGTDFIFDGEAGRPYVETDDPNPRGAYAISKLLGEWFAAEAGRWYVLRVESLFGGAAAQSSLDRIVAAIEAGAEARVFVDRTVSPSYVRDVALATRAIVDRAPACGVYHCVNSGGATWYELAQEIARMFGVRPVLRGISMADVPLRAARPRYSVLSNAKLAAAGIPMPAWQDALARYLTERRTPPVGPKAS